MAGEIQPVIEPQEPTGESGLETPGGQEQVVPEPTPVVPSPPSFEHPLLRGKSPAEVERLVEIYDNTVREQGRRITELSDESHPGRAPLTAPPSTATALPTKDQFYESPIETIQTIVDRSNAKVLDTFGQMMKPFQTDLAGRAEESVLAQLRSTLPNLDGYLPLMRGLAAQAGAILNNPGIIQAFYYMAVGQATTEGRALPGGNPPVTMLGLPQTQVPPQSRPQNVPPRPGPGAKKKLRELTENERRLAREKGQTPEEYLAYLEADSQGFLDENWKPEVK